MQFKNNALRMMVALSATTVISPWSASAENSDVVRITPFSEIEKSDGTGNRVPINTYTKLEIVGTEPNNPAVAYRKRNLLFRIGIGKKYTAAVTLISEAGKFEATTPLLTREYDSSSKTGENFLREISYDSFDYPYFLVTSDAKSNIASLSVSVDVDEATDSNTASLSLDVLSKALNAVAPSSGVVTTLTQESTSDVARTLDQSVNKLFATSVREKTSFDIALASGNQYKLKVYGPERELDELIENNAERRLVGEWTIGFAAARPSIFSDVTCKKDNATKCEKRADAELEPAEEAFNQATANSSGVLAFELVDKVGELGTISAYLKQQDWWADSVSAITSGSVIAPPYAEFCRQIRGSIAELGLNDLDGRIVAHSVAKSGLVSEPSGLGLLNQADCNYG